MGAIKRKADPADASSKRTRITSKDQLAKQRKPDLNGGQSSPVKIKTTTSAANSLFLDEERSFPRGGASVLTPLELKQIQIKANQDVLFEQSGQKRTGEDGLSELGSDAGDKPTVKSTKKRSAKKSKNAQTDSNQEEIVRVEGLNYKKLVPGTLILGRITDITAQEIVLALPNNILGYVPITAVSGKLNERLEKLLKEGDADDAEEDEDSFDDVDLREMFYVGQYLRACVLSTSDDTARMKKRLELSIEPNLVNKGLSRRKLPSNSTIQAFVVSIEDHGLVMDVGMGDAKTKGFLSKSELGPKLELSKVQEGAVYLCLVTGLNSDGRIIKLSADHSKAGNLAKGNTLTEAPTIDVFLPGTAVDVLIADTTPSTVTGKILGLVDATADMYHSTATERGIDISAKYKIGSKVKARVLFTYPDSEPKKVGVSMLEHVLGLTNRMSGKSKERKLPVDILPVSTIVEEAKVIKIQPGVGVMFELSARDIVGFAHISRLSEERVEVLSEDSGRFKLTSKHKVRVISYNHLDGLFQLSLEQKVLDQPFLRIEDIKPGQIVKGKIHKLIVDKTGASGVLVNLSEGITGLVSEIHLADVHLKHPERKFREGLPVTARVLSTNPTKHNVHLTFKKSLVNSEAKPWTSYEMIKSGATGPGLIVAVQPNGAKIRFYSDVTAWLPVAEMSEAFVEDATTHFTKGQVVNVRVLHVDAEQRKMLVSCKDPEAIDATKEAAFSAIDVGNVIQGTVTEKASDAATLDMGYGIKGILRVGHLTDGSEKKDLSTMKKIRVGATLDDLVVLQKHGRTRSITVSNKPSLRKAAQASELAIDMTQLRNGHSYHGFVRGILPDKVFVELGNGLSGAAFQSQLTDEMLMEPNFGLRTDQSVTVRVTHVDSTKGFFLLSFKPSFGEEHDGRTKNPQPNDGPLMNPIDHMIKEIGDVTFGTTVEVRIRSVKSTQVNVALADEVYGRISVAELFDSWDDIPDKKRPMVHLNMNDRISTKVLGLHDPRNHRFLPISHRSASKGQPTTFELTARSDGINTEADILSLSKVKEGDSYIAFVNNIANNFVWVNISANVRGRIDFFDLTDDLDQLANIGQNFPIGSALKVRVKAVDENTGRLDLTAATTVTGKSLQLQDLKVGYILPARVTTTHDTSVFVKIGDNVSGPIFLEQLADDYDKAKPSEYRTGDIIRVCVTKLDLPNKKLSLSARPSRVLSSTLTVKDPEITDRTQLKVNQVVRGFIKNIADNGIFVRLGAGIDAYVRINHLSDDYIKDWKSAFTVDQLVTGKIIRNKIDTRSLQMSLKPSIIDSTQVEENEFGEFEVGQVVTAKVRHVADYGVFLLIDDSANVSGLCHLSDLADTPIDKSKIGEMYKKGDAVKARIKSMDAKKRKIGFTLRYSLVQPDKVGDDDGDEEHGDEDEDMEDASDVEVIDEVESEDGGVELGDIDRRSVQSEDVDEDDETLSNAGVQIAEESARVTGLTTSGFDWTGTMADFDNKSAIDLDTDEGPTKKKKKHKATIKEDRTGDLDTYGPQSVADYERLLLGQPNSAELWIRYMLFQRELNEAEKARQIARRALATINQREEKEKLDVWTALLHLENEFASDDAVEEVFKEAIQNNDAREIHERMVKIYISSGKHQKADTLYQTMTKNKSFTPDPAFWLSYAAFLFDTLLPPSPPRARALLQRATQSVPPPKHRYLTQKFAALEFKSTNGDPERGRTLFEGLINTWPKKGDVWDMYLSLEMAHGSEENVRDLFERVIKAGGKRKRVEKVFEKWRVWEKGIGGGKGVKRVGELEEVWRKEKENEE